MWVSVGSPSEGTSKQPWHCSHDLWALGLAGACRHCYHLASSPVGMEWCSQRKEGYLQASVKGRLPFCLPDDQASGDRCSAHRFHTGHFHWPMGHPWCLPFLHPARNVNLFRTRIPIYLGRLLMKDTALLLGQICIC